MGFKQRIVVVVEFKQYNCGGGSGGGGGCGGGDEI